MELVDRVNDKNQPLSVCSKQELYKNNYHHRIVHVLIFNQEGKLGLQKVRKDKPPYGGSWSTSIGGHIQAGEAPEEAALREAEEELGITPNLMKIDEHCFKSDRGMLKFMTIFKAEHDGPFTLAKEEMDDFRFFSLEELQMMLKENAPFAPELRFLMEQYFTE